MSGDRRDIGPIGTASRIAAGLVAIVVPIASSGIGWWELFALDALVVLATVAARVVLAACERYPPRAFRSRHAIWWPPGCSLIATLVALCYAISAIKAAASGLVA
jgi:hypothetical protein